MAAFEYRALDAAGRPRGGVVEAASAALARQSLRGQGLLPVELRERAATAAAAGGRTPGGRLPPAALALVTRQMATLLGAGLRIEEALATIASGQPPRVAAVLVNLRGAVARGRSLAEALADYPAVFSDVYRASVRAGEQAGRLAPVMAHLAAHVESRARAVQSVQLALLYPALLAVVSLAIVSLLMAYVVPDIARVFRDRGADLPLLTRALIGFSGALRDHGPGALAALAALVLVLLRWSRRPSGRLWLHRTLAQGRLTARLVRRLNAARFAGTLATLLLSRVPLVDALAAAAGAVPNLWLRARVAAATEKVRQGMSLQRALTEAQCFPPMLVAMAASGEASGDLGGALDHAAADQTRDLEAWVKAVVGLAEPAILLVMGSLVMAIVLAILMPIVSLNGLAGG